MRENTLLLLLSGFWGPLGISFKSEFLFWCTKKMCIALRAINTFECFFIIFFIFFRCAGLLTFAYPVDKNSLASGIVFQKCSFLKSRCITTWERPMVSETRRPAAIKRAAGRALCLYTKAQTETRIVRRRFDSNHSFLGQSQCCEWGVWEEAAGGPRLPIWSEPWFVFWWSLFFFFLFRKKKSVC